MKKLLLITLSMIPFVIHGQNSNPLKQLDFFIGKTWVIDAKWGDGSRFSQEVSMEYGLEQNLVIVKTRGFIDAQQTQMGDRNHGIRKYDANSSKVLFWEFDVFGGVTEGEIHFKGKDIWYIYSYQGSMLADVWEFVDEETFNYSVGSYKENKLAEIYLKGVYKLKN